MVQVNVTDCCDDCRGEEDALNVGPLVSDFLGCDIYALTGRQRDGFFVVQKCIVDVTDYLVLVIINRLS